MKFISQRFFRFCVITVIAFAVHIIVPLVLHEGFDVAEEVACAVALAIVFTENFFLQRYYVYQAKAGDARRQLVLYVFSALGFRAAEYLAFLLVYKLLAIQYLLAYLSVLVVSLMSKFFFFGKFVFNGRGVDKP